MADARHGDAPIVNRRALFRAMAGGLLMRPAVAPLIEYNTKWVGINFYYIRDVVWNRVYGGDVFYFKVTVKF